jgi:hypothetical protein
MRKNTLKVKKLPIYRVYYYSRGTDSYFYGKPTWLDIKERFDIEPDDTLEHFDIEKVSIFYTSKSVKRYKRQKSFH